MMRTGVMMTAGAVLAVLAVSGCAPRPALEDPQSRAQAVNEQFARLVDAMDAHDAAAIEAMACEADARPIIPSPAVTGSRAPLDVVVDGVRVIDAEWIDISGESQDAEFHYGSLRNRDGDVDDELRVGDDAIVRVDGGGTCLWALGPGFLLFSML